MKEQTRDKTLSFTLSILMIFAFWCNTYKKSDFFSRPILYFMLMILLVLAFINFIYLNREYKVNRTVFLWFPYLLSTVFRYAMSGDIEKTIYWFICLSLLLFATREEFGNSISYKLLLAIGYIAIIGSCIQMFFPGTYYSLIGRHNLRYSEYKLSRMTDIRGYIGFFTSPGENAAALVFAAGTACLFLTTEKIKKKWAVLLCIFLTGVFLAGERSAAAIAICFPIAIYVICGNITRKKLRIALISLIAIISVVCFFTANAEMFIDSPLLKTFARSYITYIEGGDISSGRSQLFELAISQFVKHPLFGIGLGNFTKVTGAYTDVHNSYLQVLCEQGLVGFCMYIIPIISCFISTIKLAKNEMSKEFSRNIRLSIIAQLYFIMIGLVSNANIDMQAYMMYFIGIALFANTQLYYLSSTS